MKKVLAILIVLILTIDFVCWKLAELKDLNMWPVFALNILAGVYAGLVAIVSLEKKK